VRERAVVLGKIADVLARRGELDEALRIRTEEELPAYVRLDSLRDVIVGRVNVALVLLKRGRGEDIPVARDHLVWSFQAAAERGYKEADEIADIFRKLGIEIPEEA
jgi:hypothetical protein